MEVMDRDNTAHSTWSSQFFLNDLLHVWQGCHGGLAVEHLERLYILSWKEVLQCTHMLPHLDEQASIMATHLLKSLGRTQVDLSWREEEENG